MPAVLGPGELDLIAILDREGLISLQCGEAQGPDDHIRMSGDCSPHITY